MENHWNPQTFKITFVFGIALFLYLYGYKINE